MAPLKHNLVVLGSAAVVSVYAAGFARTRAAARSFTDEAVARRPARPAPADAVLPSTPAPAPAETPGVDTAHAETTHAAVAPKTPSARAAAKPPVKDTAVARAESTIAAPPPAVPAPPAPPVQTPTIKDSLPKPAVAQQPADTAAQAADKDHTVYKDGTYSGWGTSRHGDIQATVMVKDGKIVGAVISECLTQYSCSWISALPQQVLDRQSAEVDYVSGATQSANAFYSAVVNALKKAK